jgi:hypothetical protein
MLIAGGLVQGEGARIPRGDAAGDIFVVIGTART